MPRSTARQAGSNISCSRRQQRKNAHVSEIAKSAATIAEFLSGVLLVRDEGQTLAEYALILTLIAVAVVTAVILFGGKIGDMWSSINDTFQTF